MLRVGGLLEPASCIVQILDALIGAIVQTVVIYYDLVNQEGSVHLSCCRWGGSCFHAYLRQMKLSTGGYRQNLRHPSPRCGNYFDHWHRAGFFCVLPTASWG
ncbi:hypothetical protein D3C86_1644480 [compost metagenome]